MTVRNGPEQDLWKDKAGLESALRFLASKLLEMKILKEVDIYCKSAYFPQNECWRNWSRNDGISNRLALKGHKVTVFNRDRSKAQKLVATGTTNIKVADQPKEIDDSSDMVIICVKDYQAVANVSLMTGGLIETTNPDLIVIQIVLRICYTT